MHRDRLLLLLELEQRRAHTVKLVLCVIQDRLGLHHLVLPQGRLLLRMHRLLLKIGVFVDVLELPGRRVNHQLEFFHAVVQVLRRLSAHARRHFGALRAAQPCDGIARAIGGARDRQLLWRLRLRRAQLDLFGRLPLLHSE